MICHFDHCSPEIDLSEYAAVLFDRQGFSSRVDLASLVRVMVFLQIIRSRIHLAVVGDLGLGRHCGESGV